MTPRDPKTNLFFGKSDLRLGDDGTLDTVICLPGGDELRYWDTSDYRDESGALDFDRFIDEVVWPDICTDF